MTDLETVTCNECGDDFRVHPSAEAAETGYCSPACQTAGEGLA
jgi:endogenous inhibitor of DNA gyrase (YacG/DUF329 family)